MFTKLLLNQYEIPKEWQKIKPRRPNPVVYEKHEPQTKEHRKIDKEETRKSIYRAILEGAKFVYQVARATKKSESTVHLNIKALTEEGYLFRNRLSDGKYAYTVRRPMNQQY